MSQQVKGTWCQARWSYWDLIVEGKNQFLQFSSNYTNAIACECSQYIYMCGVYVCGGVVKKKGKNVK